MANRQSSIANRQSVNRQSALGNPSIGSLHSAIGSQWVHVLNGELRVQIGELEADGASVDLRQRMAQLVADIAAVADVAHPLREVGVVVLGRQRVVRMPHVTQ